MTCPEGSLKIAKTKVPLISAIEGYADGAGGGGKV
jgi:hypothetical protein